VWGGITGREIARYLASEGKLSAAPVAAAREEEKVIFEGLLRQNGTESPARIRRELRTVMDRHAGVYRDARPCRRGSTRSAR